MPRQPASAGRYFYVSLRARAVRRRRHLSCARVRRRSDDEDVGFERDEGAALALLLALPAWRWPRPRGTITGIVTDTRARCCPGVTVEATNDGTGPGPHARSRGADGFYTLPLLQPGEYEVKATLSGFRTVARRHVRVTVNETARVDLDAAGGHRSPRTSPSSAQTPLVETANATLGIVIDQQKVVDLPLNGRNFTQLGTLIPGVVAPPPALGGQTGDATPGGFGNATGGFNVNGMRNQSNNFLLDGATNNDTFNTGFVLRPPPDAIQEFKILTHSYDAEYGRNAGSVVNVVTKSGTNTLARRRLGVQPRRRAAGAQLLRAHDQAEAGAEAEPVRRRARRPARARTAVRLRLLRGLPQQQRHHRQRWSCCRRRSAAATSRRRRDPRSADRAAVPRQRDPGRPPRARSRSSCSTEFVPLPNAAGNRYIASPNVEDDREQFGIARRLPAERASTSLLGRYMSDATTNRQPARRSNFRRPATRAIATLQDVMGSDTCMLQPNADQRGARLDQPDRRQRRP